MQFTYPRTNGFNQIEYKNPSASRCDVVSHPSELSASSASSTTLTLLFFLLPRKDPNQPSPVSLCPIYSLFKFSPILALVRVRSSFVFFSISMEQEPLLPSEDLRRTRGPGSNPMLRASTLRATFTLPLTRYTTRLIAAEHHRILFGDCTENPSEDDDDRPLEDGSCAYSRPILVLDLVWNLAFVLVTAGVLLSTFTEHPSTPLRLWLCGYAFECILHMVFVCFEYWRRTRDFYGPELGPSLSQVWNSNVKKLESMNTLVSSIWWVLGFYWIVVGGQQLLQDCPRIYWLTVVFLAFDVFFIIFCIGMVCIVFFALFFFIPIVALAYAMRIREGASEEDIRSLPKYKFSQSNSLVMVDDSNKQVSKARMGASNSNLVSELYLNPDDSECCICLSPYVEGAELYRLPCTHHFHCGCISRWLRTKSTCPLCKFNILRSDTLV